MKIELEKTWEITPKGLFEKIVDEVDSFIENRSFFYPEKGFEYINGEQIDFEFNGEEVHVDISGEITWTYKHDDQPDGFSVDNVRFFGMIESIYDKDGDVLYR